MSYRGETRELIKDLKRELGEGELRQGSLRPVLHGLVNALEQLDSRVQALEDQSEADRRATSRLR